MRRDHDQKSLFDDPEVDLGHSSFPTEGEDDPSEPIPPRGKFVTSAEANQLNRCPDNHGIIKPGIPWSEVGSFFPPGRWGGSSTSGDVPKESRERPDDLRSHLHSLGLSERSAWNGTHLGFDMRVELSPTLIQLAEQVTEIARSLFATARRNGEAYRQREGLDARAYETAVSRLGTSWNDLFENVGEFGYPSLERIKEFRELTRAEQGNAIGRGVPHSKRYAHTLGQMSAAGAALESLYNLHTHILFEGIFAGARTVFTSREKQFLAQSEALREFGEALMKDSSLAPFHHGRGLKLQALRPLMEQMALDPRFDHPKVGATGSIIRSLSASHLETGVIIFTEGGLQSELLAAQLRRISPDVPFAVANGSTTTRDRAAIAAAFAGEQPPVLITDLTTLQSLSLGRTPRLAVLYSSPRIYEDDSKMIPLAEVNIRLHSVLPPS